MGGGPRALKRPRPSSRAGWVPPPTFVGGADSREPTTWCCPTGPKNLASLPHPELALPQGHTTPRARPRRSQPGVGFGALPVPLPPTASRRPASANSPPSHGSEPAPSAHPRHAGSGVRPGHVQLQEVVEARLGARLRLAGKLGAKGESETSRPCTPRDRPHPVLPTKSNPRQRPWRRPRRRRPGLGLPAVAISRLLAAAWPQQEATTCV